MATGQSVPASLPYLCLLFAAHTRVVGDLRRMSCVDSTCFSTVQVVEVGVLADTYVRRRRKTVWK